LVTGGLFQGNACLTENCRGGALTSGAALTLTGTQFIQNTSAGIGGAVQVESSTPNRLVNALFARNSAATSGAALYASASAGTTLLHLTIVGPGTNAAPALHNTSGALTVYDTILGDYTVGISLTGGTAFEDYNLFFNLPTPTASGVTSGLFSFSGNPAFASPASNDYHLLYYSEAINAGLDAGVDVDFEGDLRPLDGGFDIGFDEYALHALFLPLLLR
jgi:predicted outer membrane repeat protein